jgi:two-component system, OmpR family, sensor kinase
VGDREDQALISLRSTALAWLAVLLLVIGGVTAASSYILVSQDAKTLLDGQLRQIAYFIGDTTHGPVPPVPNDPSYDPDDDFLIQVWNADGGIVRTSDPARTIARASVTGFSEAYPNRGGWRTFTYITPERTVQISQMLEMRRELAMGAALRAALPILLLIPLSWVLLGFSITRVIRHLDKLASRVAARPTSDRTPISMTGVPVEVAPLVRSMNALLERLQQAMERQHRFIVDAAHELRTPIAALQLQIGNLRGAEGAERLERMKDVEAGVRRSSNLIAQLLKLARYENASETNSSEKIDLYGIARSCVRDLTPLACRLGITMDLAVGPCLMLHADAAELRVLVSNILDNAIRYTPPGGHVDLNATTTAEGGILEVRDSGPGIPDELLDRVFDRFFRAAGQEIEGSGLGLAIAKSIADRHGLSIVLSNVRVFSNVRNRSGLVVQIIVPSCRLIPS